MNINQVEVKYTGNNKPRIIIPIEAHISRRTRSNGFCRSTWLKFIQRVEKDPMCYVVFVGDLRDVDRPSTRERRAIMGLGRNEILEEDDLQDMDEINNYILPDLKRIKNKIIGMVDGDHFRVYGNRKTSTQYICEKLGIPNAYLGERMGWVRMTFRDGYGSLNYDIFVRHGKGAASTFGSDVNALVRQSTGFDADLYLGGHTHKQWFIKVPHLYPAKYEIKQRMVGYARAGSLLRGFIYGNPTYAESCEYNPLSIGWPEIQLTVNRMKGSTSANGNKAWNLRVADIKGLN